MEVLKKVILTVTAAMLLLPLGAQERSDTVYVFRFVAGRDMFYVPWSGNGDELSRLEACVGELKMRIVAGEVPIFVDGYCDSQESEAGNLAVAKIRSNRVKSELIVRQGVSESCFVTRNHSGGGNYVTVRIAVPAAPKEDAAAEEAERQRAEQERAAREEAAKAERRAAEEAERAARAKAEAERQAELAAIAAQEKAEAERKAAEEAAAKRADKGGCWYAGISASVPFAVSAYTAFAGDKTRAGWSAGIYGGYRFNRVLSLELQAAWGHANLASRSCCPDYWIGADGSLYEGAVANGTGWDWHDLKSRVSMQRYGLQLNVNVLGFFDKTRQSRWTIEVSPLLAVYGTQADFQNIASGQTVYEGGTRWHLGVGGNLQAGYALTEHINIGIYSGIAHLTGKPLDGTPSHLHKANFIWESGLRLGWNFGKQGKEGKR